MALFLGAHPDAKPVEAPGLKPAAATCALQTAKSVGQQSFAATISAPASHAVEGKYALTLKGRGTSSVSIDDTRFALTWALKSPPPRVLNVANNGLPPTFTVTCSTMICPHQAALHLSKGSSHGLQPAGGGSHQLQLPPLRSATLDLLRHQQNCGFSVIATRQGLHCRRRQGRRDL